MHPSRIPAGLQALFLLSIFLFAPLGASAARVQEARQGNHDFILILGEITRETQTSFMEALSRAPRARIVVEGPGGEVIPALDIGRTIRERRLTTLIPERGNCASSCGLIWLAGQPRDLASSAAVGFHAAAAVSPSGRRSISAPANAIIGGYLRELGFGDEAIFEMTRAPPRGMNWFGPARLAALGVTFGTSSAQAARAMPPPPAMPSQIAPPQVVPPLGRSPQMASLDGLWEGEFRCGRETRAARMLVWADGGRLGASFEFGPSAASPNLAHGAFQMRGSRLPDGKVRFQPETISVIAPGDAPIALLAWLEGGLLQGEVLNRQNCAPVSLRKARG